MIEIETTGKHSSNNTENNTQDQAKGIQIEKVIGSGNNQANCFIPTHQIFSFLLDITSAAEILCAWVIPIHHESPPMHQTENYRKPPTSTTRHFPYLDFRRLFLFFFCIVLGLIPVFFYLYESMYIMSADFDVLL